jgi:hypothetical protein
MRPLFNFQRLLKMTDVKPDDSDPLAAEAAIAKFESLATDMANAEYAATSMLQTEAMQRRLRDDGRLNVLASRIAVVTQIDENFSVCSDTQPYDASHSS